LMDHPEVAAAVVGEAAVADAVADVLPDHHEADC